MDVNSFWKLIDTTREMSFGNLPKQADLLVDSLILLTEDEIFSFHINLWNLMDEAYDAALWDAADIIDCGCSDDGFEDFRAWLITQGKEIYEKALINPEILVDLVEVGENTIKGNLLSVFINAYERKTGQEKIPVKYRKPPQLKGLKCPEENRKERFPKLAAKFGDCNRFDNF